MSSGRLGNVSNFAKHKQKKNRKKKSGKSLGLRNAKSTSKILSENTNFSNTTTTPRTKKRKHSDIDSSTSTHDEHEPQRQEPAPKRRKTINPDKPTTPGSPLKKLLATNARQSTENKAMKKKLHMANMRSVQQSNANQRKSEVIKTKDCALKNRKDTTREPYQDLSLKDAARVLIKKLCDSSDGEKRSLAARASENAVLEQLFEVVNDRIVDYRSGVYAQGKKQQSKRDIRTKEAAWTREFIEKRIAKYQLSSRGIF